MALDYPKLSLWYDRWLALDSVMEEMESFYKDGNNLPRKNTLLSLVRGLRAFGSAQFQFFYNGFTKTGKPELELSAKFPPEHVLHVTLEQIGNDLEVFERATIQRLKGTAEEKNALAKADALAWKAIQPAIKKLKKSDVTALTYFHKSPNIRVMPYAKAMLIGVPYTVTRTTVDYLAIPHEVGHYAFWNMESTRDWWKNNVASVADQSGKKADKAFRTWWRDRAGNCSKWWEEIFADIYAALIAGPIEALDFQEQALQHSRAGFLKSKDEHPSPVLRPRIFNKVLKDRGEWGNLPEELDKHWQEHRLERVDKNDPSKINARIAAQLGEDPSKKNARIGAKLDLDKKMPIDRLVILGLKMLSDVRSDWFRGVAGLSLEEVGKQMEPQIIEVLKQAKPPDDEAEVIEWNEWKRQFSLDANTSIVLESDWLPVFKADDWTGGGENDPAH